MLRKLLLAQFLSLLAGAAAAAVPWESVRVASYNILQSTMWVGTPHDWSQRRDAVADTVRRMNADVIGFQEVRWNRSQFNFLRVSLPRYAWVGDFCYKSKRHPVSGCANKIGYDAKRFKLLAGGTFWMSLTPDVPGSRSWKEPSARTCTYARLKDMRSGKSFCFLSTHLAGYGQQRKELEVVVSQLEKVSGGDPVVLVGDFNSGVGSQAHAPLTNDLCNAYLISKTPPQGPKSTSCGGFRPHWTSPRRLDHIYVSKGTQVFNYLTVPDRRPGSKFTPSDHAPILATILPDRPPREPAGRIRVKTSEF